MKLLPTVVSAAAPKRSQDVNGARVGRPTMMQKIDSKLGETAMHEAAHAVVAVKAGCGLAENGVVTIEPDGHVGGRVNVGQMSAEQHILTTLAGGMAEARLKNIAHEHLGQPPTNLMVLIGGMSGDAETIAHLLNLLHPSRQMAALEWLVFELNLKLGRRIPATVAASHDAFSRLNEVEAKDARLLADLFVFALVVLCARGDSKTARQVISLNIAIPYARRMTVLRKKSIHREFMVTNSDTQLPLPAH